MGYPSDFLRRPADMRNDRHERLPAAESAPAFRWVPIRSLAERHRPRILKHLFALDVPDRYLRFGYPASDAQIGHYVDLLDFDHDEVFGIFNRRLELIAMAHLAYIDAHAPAPRMAEFGVSVLPKSRGRGYGARLFDHAVLHARNRGVDALVIQALSENVAMLRIAKNAGASVVREGAESMARLKLPPEDLASRVGELVEGSAAELDYQLKVQARKVDELLKAVAEVKEHLGKNANSAES